MLFINELLFMIASDLKNQYYVDYASEQDLLAFILTCRTFSGPGLDALWQSLNDIGPVMNLFPQGIVTTARVFPLPTLEAICADEAHVSNMLSSTSLASSFLPQRRYTFTSASTRQHWQTVLTYTKRVKRFSFFESIHQRCLQSFPPVTFQDIMLYPTLRHLVWDSTAAENLRYIRLFMAPTLISADIVPLTVSKLASFVQLARDVTPNLRIIEFTHESLDFSPQNVTGNRNLQQADHTLLEPPAAWRLH
ncbi:hypothetical protein QCA50_012585 [Cerrena zonata]|uniref:Uncharacterized protein n=1 Tax=Cerrena zonata TaxID=2478898 RepID=A0AAW0FTZ8_9APHY